MFLKVVKKSVAKIGLGIAALALASGILVSVPATVQASTQGVWTSINGMLTQLNVSVPDDMSMRKGKKTKLKVKYSTKVSAKVAYKSNKKSRAVISSKGVITAKKRGTAVITTKVHIKGTTDKLTFKTILTIV